MANFNNNNIKGIIFDYGGTIDSRGRHWSEVIWDGFQAAKLNVDKDRFRDAYVYAERELARHPHIMPDDNFHSLMIKKLRIETDRLIDRGIISREDGESKYQAIARYCYEAARQCVDEARPTLEALAARYPMVLVSNFYGNVETVLADFGLTHLFRAIIESAIVGVRKPDPAIFALGVEALSLPANEVLVVGDSYKKDILPAESLNCQVAWLKGKGWTSEEDAVTHPAIISSLTELTDTLL